MKNKNERKSKSNKTEENFQINWNAEDYSTHSSAQESWAIELMDKIKMEGTERYLIPTIMAYKERKGLSGWIRTTWHPYLDCLPEAKKQKFIRLIVDGVENKIGLDDNGVLVIPMMRLEVIAIKGEIK
ncbi:hypothetical protein HOG98_06960 [bacterium]|jgi:hypothetical protein|nr:hypothetical protein [bacterium]